MSRWYLGLEYFSKAYNDFLTVVHCIIIASSSSSSSTTVITCYCLCNSHSWKISTIQIEQVGLLNFNQHNCFAQKMLREQISLSQNHHIAITLSA